MPEMNRGDVDSYLADGCGRCEKYRTPDCKVHHWAEVLVPLRDLLRETELDEQLKWGSPCYSLDGRNVVMITAFNDRAGLSFFKGVLLDDPDGLLQAPGPNSQAVRELRFTSSDEVEAHRDEVRRFLDEAIELERSGANVEFAKEPEPMPDELRARLDDDPTLAAAFDALTPGRQRSHILHVGGAKKSETRVNRVEKCAPRILAGKGFNEY